MPWWSFSGRPHSALSTQHRQVEALQQRARPDARQLQELRAVDRAARQDHLGFRPQGAVLAVLQVFHANGATLFITISRVTMAPVSTTRFLRRIAGRRKARAAELRRRPLIVI